MKKDYYFDCAQKNLDKKTRFIAKLEFNRFFNKNMKILDIGCLKGHFISVNPENIQGVEINQKAVDLCIKQGFDVKQVDIEKGLPFKDESFDGIYISHVIEHLNDPLLALKGCYRVLKKGGKIVIKTPDYNKWGGFWDDYTHKFPLTKKSLGAIVMDAGFEKIIVDYDYKQVRGFGILLRKGIIKNLEQLRNLQKKFGMKSPALVCIAIKI